MSGAPACWLAMSTDCSELLLQGGLDVLQDWTIAARPPLHLLNQLPVAAHYELWERNRIGGALILRQKGLLEGGQGINVYSMDMRQQVGWGEVVWFF